MRSDIAIVGAGPAGSAAARALALSGAAVVVFDPSHPREKPCGGGLTARALHLVGDAVLRRVPGVVVRGTRFASGPLHSPTSARFSLPDDRTLVVSSRRVLDQALLDAALCAGARLVPERVVDVRVDADGVTVSTRGGASHHAGFLLGADGANSLVRRRLRGPFARQQLSIATGMYAYGVTEADIALHCVASPPGYLWSFPRPDHLAIGICAPADVASAAGLRRSVDEWVRCAGYDRRTTFTRYSWPIPSLSRSDFTQERPAGPRWMLLGDAAGLVDPLTREGIYYALQSGLIAAQALAQDAEAERVYGDRLRAEIFPELGRAAALKDRFFTSRFTDLLVDALRRSPRVRVIMNALIAGEQPYATLMRRLIATFEVRLALQLLMLQLQGHSE